MNVSPEWAWVAAGDSPCRDEACPYFSQANRRLETGAPGPRRANARTPLAKPKDEPGVLWEAFREGQEPA